MNPTNGEYLKEIADRVNETHTSVKVIESKIVTIDEYINEQKEKINCLNIKINSCESDINKLKVNQEGTRVKMMVLFAIAGIGGAVGGAATNAIPVITKAIGV